MTPPKNLRDLLREHIDRTGDSYGQIATKTGMSKALVGAIMVATTPRTYRAETIDRIAHGLHLPRDVVSRAAAVSAGLTVDQPDTPADREDARVITEQLPLLTDAELATLRAMVQALAEAHDRP